MLNYPSDTVGVGLVSNPYITEEYPSGCYVKRKSMDGFRPLQPSCKEDLGYTQELRGNTNPHITEEYPSG
jgi:hypothetical protein